MMPKCQGTLAQKKVPYLKIKWLQQDSKPQPLSSWMNTQPFSQTDQMTEWMIDWLIEMNDFLKKLRFTPFKAEQPLEGMELQEKETQKDMQEIGIQERHKEICLETTYS